MLRVGVELETGLLGIDSYMRFERSVDVDRDPHVLELRPVDGERVPATDLQQPIVAVEIQPLCQPTGTSSEAELR